MENLILNSIPDAPPSDLQAADNQPKRTKAMTEAALAANRANAQKSTGPRTEKGKLKAASNSLKHGLFSLKKFESFVADYDDALAVVTNFTEQFNPVTPTEVALVHQLIHMQLRFLQMEFLYGEAMRFRVSDIITQPVSFLPAIMRELDRLPTKIQRTIKLLRQEIAQREARGETLEIEPIEDAPKLPPRPPEELYAVMPTNNGDIPLDKLPQAQQIAKTDPQASINLAKKIIAEFVNTMNAKYDPQPPTPTDKI
jgi:hypothetical protein